MLWRTEVYSSRYYSWMEPYSPVKKSGPHGVYYRLQYTDKQKAEVLRHVRKSRCWSKTFQARWDRSSDCRKKFFRNSLPPYKCSYCGRGLSKQEVQVDHIIPVSGTKYSVRARNLLAVQGIYDVNDTRNLAASCRKCNQRKGNRVGLSWILMANVRGGRAIIGIFRAVCCTAIMAAAVAMFLHLQA